MAPWKLQPFDFQKWIGGAQRGEAGVQIGVGVDVGVHVASLGHRPDGLID